jgi:methionine-rich copper-binding protein CopC
MKSFILSYVKKRLLLLVISLGVPLSLLWTTPAAAHFGLIRSEPSDGEVLQSAPEMVYLWFEGELDTFESVMEVIDEDGKQVDLVDAMVSLDDRTELRVSLPANLPPGEFTIRYTAVDNEDSHTIDGELAFTIAGAQSMIAPSGLNANERIWIEAGLVIVVLFGILFLRRRLVRD